MCFCFIFFPVPLILFTSSQISKATLIWQASDLHRTLEILFQMSKQNYKDPRGWSTDFRILQQTQINFKRASQVQCSLTTNTDFSGAPKLRANQSLEFTSITQHPRSRIGLIVPNYWVVNSINTSGYKAFGKVILYSSLTGLEGRRKIWKSQRPSDWTKINRIAPNMDKTQKTSIWFHTHTKICPMNTGIQQLTQQSVRMFWLFGQNLYMDLY